MNSVGDRGAYPESLGNVFPIHFEELLHSLQLPRKNGIKERAAQLHIKHHQHEMTDKETNSESSKERPGTT